MDFIALVTILAGIACFMSASPAEPGQQVYHDWLGGIAGVVFLAGLIVCLVGTMMMV